MPGAAAGKPKRLKLTAPEPSEDALHKSVRQLLDVALLLPAFWTTFPSGMYELPTSAGGRLKAYGLKEGVPDILALYEGRLVWLELKRLKGKISRAQQLMHRTLELAGSHVYVCRSQEAVVHALMTESFPLRSGVVRQLLTNSSMRSERQITGDFHLGQTAPDRGGSETEAPRRAEVGS